MKLIQIDDVDSGVSDGAILLLQVLQSINSNNVD
jgi:hypothetical protein